MFYSTRAREIKVNLKKRPSVTCLFLCWSLQAGEGKCQLPWCSNCYGGMLGKAISVLGGAAVQAYGFAGSAQQISWWLGLAAVLAEILLLKIANEWSSGNVALF